MVFDSPAERGNTEIVARRFRTSFGPGLLWAATSIGVSHLVQSTRGGAMAGFALVGVILVALVVKYPFFEYGSRYAAATGKSLVEGYRGIGTWALWLFLLISLATAIVSQAAMALFASYLVRYALGDVLPLSLIAAVLMSTCMGLLWVGRYKGLDIAIKILLFLLVLSTLAATTMVAPRADLSSLALWPADIVGTAVPFAFVLALVGWMPSPVDVAVWSSLWTLAKDKTTGVRTPVADARRDFLVGYIGTAVLALAFVTLGATVLNQADVVLSDAGAVFSTQLVEMYSQTLGAWSRPIVFVAAFATIFSSLLAIIDGFPRALERTWCNLQATTPEEAEIRVERYYWTIMIAFSAAALLIIVMFVGSLTSMVDFATIVSFLTAPLLGYLNFKVITSADVPPEHRPGRAMIAVPAAATPLPRQ